MNGLNELAHYIRAINEANGWVTPEDDTPVHQIAVLALIGTEVGEAIEEVRDGRLEDHMTIGDKHVYPVTDGTGADWTTDPRGDGLWLGKHGPKTWTGVTPKPVGLPSELADVIIRTLDFAATHGIDIELAIQRKLAYNATRGHRHGGKAL